MAKPPTPTKPNRKARRAALQGTSALDALVKIRPGAKLALLFGAGASYGYTPRSELNPPLGGQFGVSRIFRTDC